MNNSIPSHYIPKTLTDKDKKKQKQYIQRSRKQYQKNKYFQRPRVKSFKSKPSRHVEKAKHMYNVDTLQPNSKLAGSTKCSLDTLNKIVNKGRGAYYSSGSRPNQTAESWGLARLGSAITGGNSSIVDYHLLEEGCSPSSKALQLAKQTCNTQKKKCGNLSIKNKSKKSTTRKKK